MWLTLPKVLRYTTPDRLQDVVETVQGGMEDIIISVLDVVLTYGGNLIL